MPHWPARTAMKWWRLNRHHGVRGLIDGLYADRGFDGAEARDVEITCRDGFVCKARQRRAQDMREHRRVFTMAGDMAALDKNRRIQRNGHCFAGKRFSLGRIRRPCFEAFDAGLLVVGRE